jgi:putative FmdB family regulatory protein
MPLFEFQCKKCNAITEALLDGGEAARAAVPCARCGSRATTKIISPVSFKIAQPAKYSDAFLDKAQPFLKNQKETAQFFAEGKGSEDAKTFQLAEKIGERIDRTLAKVTKGVKQKV